MGELLVYAALVLVAVVGTMVVRTHDPSALAVVLSGYGLVLALLFIVLQAPDVALSQIAVGTAVTPLMVMLAIRTIARHRAARDAPDTQDRSGR
jgi:energy-converting hydrogenase B subunit D